MNGLKFIRRQCNFSLGMLSEKLGVTRQMISAWESGKKDISSARKQQLEEFFGVDKSFFAEISEEQKQLLLKKAMFRYNEGEEETYRYKPDIKRKPTCVYFMPEKEYTLDEEIYRKKHVQKELMNRIDKMITGSTEVGLMDQITAINRGCTIFGKTVNLMEESFSKCSVEKMIYYSLLKDVLSGMELVFENGDISNISGLSGRVERIADMIKMELNDALKMIPRKNNAMQEAKHDVENEQSNPPLAQVDMLELNKKIKQAEETYANMELPDEAVNAPFMIGL